MRTSLSRLRIPKPFSRASILLLILLLSFTTRAFIGQFMSHHLADAQFFQPGTFAGFHDQAERMLDGRAPYFWLSEGDSIDDIQRCPGYSLWIALIYRVSGVRSAAAVQSVQWALDAFSVLLVFGIGLTAFGWRTGILAGLLASLSPILALYGTWPLADAPASWFVLAGVWMLLLANKRQSWKWALSAGLMIGASCWMRANALLLLIWWIPALMLLTRMGWRKAALICAAVLLGGTLALAPIAIRNTVAVKAFIPVRLGSGTLLWEGIGETERGAEFGAVANDAEVIEQERASMGLAPDAPLELFSPDGVARDYERGSKAIAVIRNHPVWFAGVMLRRMWAMIDFNNPAHLNVTVSLPYAQHSALLTYTVQFLGMLQSASSSLYLALMAGGILLAFRKEWRTAGLLLATVAYYFVMNSIMHMEHRYNLPLHALLLVFAGYSLQRLSEILGELLLKYREQRLSKSRTHRTEQNA